MGDNSKLVNTGLFEIKNSTSVSLTSPRTIIIFGVPRSGTSIVSGALHHLGVFGGERSFDPIYEDHQFSEAIQSGSWETVNSVIHEYNSHHEVWSYKRPDLLSDCLSFGLKGRVARVTNRFFGRDRYLPLSNFIRLHHMFRNPIYIVTFKDIFAIANRNRISMDSDLLTNMEDVLRTYRKIPKLLKKLEPNALLVSSEKTVHKKELFLDKLIEFCHLSPTLEQKQQAFNFISENPSKYLESARIDRTMGHLDIVNTDVISGWARYIDNEDIAEVVLLVDGREMCTTPANVFRQDLLDGEIHPTGECGFQFTGFDPGKLRTGCEVRVKVAGDAIDLKGSPYCFKEG